MCQFNLVFTKDLKNKKILEINEYNYFGDDFDNFSPYFKGYCNCGSFVGSMAEYNGNSYFEMIENLNKSEIEKFNNLKILMNKPNYKELKEKYLADLKILSNAFKIFHESISNYEMEQINILEEKYSGKDLEKHMGLLYKELGKKISDMHNSTEFKSAQAKIDEFMKENELLGLSTIYYLTKKDEDNAKKSREILDVNSDDSIEYTDLPEESLVIDTVIQKLENKYQNNYNDFLEYKQLFETLLENEEYILFCCIWSEPENLSIEKEVNIKNLKIENLASLKYNQILKIFK